MTQQYKRGVCHMCPFRDQCDGLRWSTYCGTCPDSLKCAAQKGIGNTACQKLKSAWLDLPRKCLLAQGLLHRKATTENDPFIPGEQDLKCPRCGQEALSCHTDHGLNYMFKRVSTYTLVCDYCGIDETVEVG
jgi:hypothetical protein